MVGVLAALVAATLVGARAALVVGLLVGVLVVPLRPPPPTRDAAGVEKAKAVICSYKLVSFQPTIFCISLIC